MKAADPPVELGDSGGTWRERAVERSLRDARARAQDRSSRFLTAAEELLTETGRPDFTVQQLVERTRMSLRSFYQHFGSKDELLLVLFQERLRLATDVLQNVCDEVGDPLRKLQVVVETLYGTPTSAVAVDEARAMRALALYHLQLADQRPDDFAGVLAPLKQLIVGIVAQGAQEDRFRTDLDAEALAVMVLQSLVSATMLLLLNDRLMGAPLRVDQLWAFLWAAVERQEAVPGVATPSAGRVLSDS
jgi:AcrR family transcriptional regulator